MIPAIARGLLASALLIAPTGCALLDLVRDQALGEADVTPGLPQATPGPGQTRRVLRTKFGPEIKLIDNARYTGALYGFRSVRHLTFWRPVYVGGMAYGSLPLPNGAGVQLAPLFGYAGLLVGYEWRVPGLAARGDEPAWLGFSQRNPPWLGLDANLHLGLTQDLASVGPNPLGQNLSLEPSLSLSLPLPFLRGLRLAASGGYLYLPFAADYSGWTISLRVEGKTIETRMLIDE
ncbi:MAG: hypothetical protein VKP62_15215 [Candidatus Sericytochromatia bacterium]|nr:hypothetical protein [Candidatus Sericytochromatia bacterium]